MAASHPVHLVSNPASAATLLDPIRMRVLQQIEEPDSAAGIARRLRLPRQKVNYHLRQLESAGLAEFVGERKKGNCMERLLRASARSYLISPQALGQLGADPSRVADRLSSAYLVAVAAKTIRDLATLQERAGRAGKKLATLTLQAQIRFASAERRHQFASELANQIARLAAQYHEEAAPGGRSFQLVVGAYPALAQDKSSEPILQGDQP